MARWKQYGAYALIAVGVAAATAGADIVEGRQTALGVALGGSALAWGGVALLDRVSEGRWCTDERFRRICHRSAFVTWWLVMAALFTLLVAVDHLARPPTADTALSIVMGIALIGFLGATSWYERRM